MRPHQFGQKRVRPARGVAPVSDDNIPECSTSHAVAADLNFFLTHVASMDQSPVIFTASVRDPSVDIGKLIHLRRLTNDGIFIGSKVEIGRKWMTVCS